MERGGKGVPDRHEVIKGGGEAGIKFSMKKEDAQISPWSRIIFIPGPGFPDKFCVGSGFTL